MIKRTARGVRFAAIIGILILADSCGRHAAQHAAATETRAASPDAPAATDPADPGEMLSRQAAERLVGTRAPKLTLKTIDGEIVRLADLYGRKAVYLKFWATWCVPCREQMPHFERVARSAGNDLSVIAVNTGFNDDAAQVRDYRHKLGLTMPIGIDEDGRFARAFDLRVTPQHVVIGKDGRIAYIGHLADARLDDALRRARLGIASPSRVEEAGATSADPPMLDAPLGTVNAGEVRLRPAPGERHFLLFFASWCESYWKTSRPGASSACHEAREISQERKGDRRWIGIASRLWSSAPDLAAYSRSRKVEMPLVLDSSGALFRSFRVTAIPTVVVLGPSGAVERRIEGSSAHFGAALRMLEHSR